MAKKRWQRRELLQTIQLDKPGYSLRVYRITWPDGSQCIQIMKYAVQPATGRDTPYMPQQYVQVPLPLWDSVAEAVAQSLAANS